MITIAYFEDGPLHGTHAELPRPDPEWNVVKPSDVGRSIRIEPDLDVFPTIRTGTYKRDREPGLTGGTNERVFVFKYRWAGWR